MVLNHRMTWFIYSQSTNEIFPILAMSAQLVNIGTKIAGAGNPPKGIKK